GRRAEWSVHEGDAAEFDPEGCTVAFYFNPFGPDTLASTLGRLEAVSKREGRDVRIGYLHLTEENARVLEARPSVTPVRVVHTPGFRHPVHYFTLRG
ncbi:MAG: hypothetical protein MK082_13575, partial [Phycisphaerales bacterium]|nr:hypothetical protein [Phycisphaerales bacterium]